MARHAAVLIACLILVAQADGRERFQLGGAGGQPWSDWGELRFVDADRVPGSVQPFETEASHNLISSMRSRGGDICCFTDTYTQPTDWLEGGSEFVIDGDPTTAFVHPPRIKILGSGGGFWTVPLVFDLGASFLVDRIRFYTRADHPQNQMRRYILYLNDGTAATADAVGNPIWSKYREEIDNLNHVVDLDIEPQMVRHIFILPGTIGSGGGLSETWEVAEMEVYGQGFVPEATFVSRPIPLGAPASLGQIHWGWRWREGARVVGEKAGRAQVVVQTRSGIDDQPYVYWRQTGVGDEISPLDDRGRELTATTYAQLRSNKAGITDDLTNWSPWQTYDLDRGLGGTQILSPSPRAYVQVRVQFAAAGLAGAQLDSLFFEHSPPPVSSVVGEIHPNVVEPARRTLFTYTVRSRVDAGQSGFNALRLRTAAQVDSITAVRIDRVPQAGFVAERIGGDWTIRFPRIERDQTLLEVDFLASVYRYGTPFNSAVLDTDADDVPLEVVAGDAIPEVTSDELMVRIGLSDDLVAGLRVAPNPFSPNGDGRNDRTAFSFSLLRLTEATPVTVRIFDLSGRLVQRLQARPEGSRAVELEWTGLDEDGHLVPPGLYLYRLSVDSDGGRQESVGHVAVAY